MSASRTSSPINTTSAWSTRGTTKWDQVVFRGEPDSGEFIAFWLQERRVLAGMNVNVWDVNGHIRALIRSGWPVEPEALRDTNVALELLAGELAR